MSGWMRDYINEHKKQEPNNAEVYAVLNKIKANHFIFIHFQRNSFKWLFDKGMVMHIEAGKHVYQRKRIMKRNIYFVMHGELEYRDQNDERFGERVTIGFSVGEEI